MDLSNIQFTGDRIKQNLPPGKTIASLAREIGISRQSLGAIVNGRSKPCADTLIRIFLALPVTAFDLADGQ